MPLTDTRICALKPGDKPTKHGDGGKQKRLAFGACPDVSIARVCAHRDAAKKLLADDVGPSQKKKRDKIAKADAATNSFESLAEAFLERTAAKEIQRLL